jgi:hypothetical protein
MLYREIIAVCCEIRTKHVNTLCGQNVEFSNVKRGGTYSDHWALEGYITAVNMFTTCLNIQVFCVLPTQCTSVFCVTLAANSASLPAQHLTHKQSLLMS